MGLPVPSGGASRAGGYAAVPSPFSMSEQTFRGLGHDLVDTLAAYLEQLPREPVYRPLPEEVRQELEKMDIPAEGTAPGDVIEGFLRLVLPYGRGQNHPCFAAFVDPAASKLSMLAAFASAVTNTSGAGGNYAAIYVEQAVVRWLMELVGFPRDGGDGEPDPPAGHRPFLVAANAGTVKTGAIDPLEDLSDFCRQEGLWLHVDGAYGGFGVLDPRLADRYAGLERADSVALDPHKWLAVAIGCSCAMIREGPLLQDTYKLIPSYLSMTPGQGFAGEVWYSHRSAEQTRDSGRALKTLWNIQQAGKAGLADHVRRHIDLARYLEQVIDATPGPVATSSRPACGATRPA